ncbi:methyltransferase domain-containing protein [Pseudodesulfovibrio cashew]|uniref:Methyltransferase domain-containing protein n=1 Tax=Pseudodesulfovibrio cashew TaxID=2678688 RepID=A0A6I6JBR6_9BACT|nr:class I SAM-dependent methyltransferase [Pseudodesulfovibrio cashew]QGY39521.1 methyltransferase domain-containing protein [Pseudodesulfovibrio cashew]
MKKYENITIGGEVVRKHRRDIRKDEIIFSHIPDKKCAVFESSAGAAILSRQLRDQGHDVTISNYYLQNFKDIKEIHADLNQPLELPDSSFDVVICREVIEHVESVPHVLREFNRILKPGGTLVLTFPNRLQIRSRFLHLFSGFYRGMKSPINLDVPFGEAHINLIGYPEMDYFLRKTGYEVKTVESSYFQKSDRLFSLIRPLIRFTTRHYLLKYKKNAQEHEKTKPENIAYNTFIAETLLSDALFFGKDVIVTAHKQN